MLSVTNRQKLVAVSAAVLGLALVVCSVLGLWRVALALAGVLMAAALIVSLDLRRRAGELIAKNSDQRALIAAIDDVTKSADVGGLMTSLSQVETAVRNHGRQLKDSNRDVMTRFHDQAREFEALIQLFTKVTPRAPMPSARPWAPTAPDLLSLYSLVEHQRPALVLELGSGASTVWLGYALANAGSGRLVSVDHLEGFGEGTRAAVELHGLGASTEVRLAPLRPVELGDEAAYHWYDEAAFADLDQIDMIFVDGPPGGTRPEARYPALPMLLDRLASNALIVLADADPATQQKIMDKWLDQIPGLERQVNTVGTHEILRYTQPRPVDRG